MNTCPPIEIEARLKAEFDVWFAKLQELSPEKLDPEDWTGRWFDGYTPTDALAAGCPTEGNPPETRAAEEWVSRDDHIAATEAIRAEYMQRLLGSEPPQAAEVRDPATFDRMRSALEQIVADAESDDGATAWDGADIARAALSYEQSARPKEK